jgi:alpha-tubulin suppressor-like RCC1 family protein
VVDVQLDNMYFDGERLKQVACGKFHSLFLTQNGKVFATGYNKYGQLGVSNSMFMHAEEPIEVFTDGLKIEKVSAGWHHNLLLAEDGKLYGFGARINGQLNGINYEGREE